MMNSLTCAKRLTTNVEEISLPCFTVHQMHVSKNFQSIMSKTWRYDLAMHIISLSPRRSKTITDISTTFHLTRNLASRKMQEHLLSLFVRCNEEHKPLRDNHGIRPKAVFLSHCTWDTFGDILASSGGRHRGLFDKLVSLFSTRNMYSSAKLHQSYCSLLRIT